MQYLSVYEFTRGDLSSVYKVTEHRDYPATLNDLKDMEPNTFYLFPRHLSYGDYDNSCHIERSNVRVFIERFKKTTGWKLKKYPYHGEAVCIDLTCGNQEIIRTLIQLEDYPLLDECDSSLMALQMEKEAWDSYIKRDFIGAIKQKFNADDSDPDDNRLFKLYEQLKRKANVYSQIDNSNVSIDLKRMVNCLSKPPSCAKLEWF